MKILITGSSGLVGSALIDFLVKKHHQVYRLVRQKPNLASNEIEWDPQKGILHAKSLEKFNAVVHLAGENIGGKWTENKKRKILESRINGTSLLCRSLSQLEHPPETLISGSAIGYYGNRGDEILIESSSKGEGFLAHVCQMWEEATEPALLKGIRTVLLRTGVVLSSKGGVLKNMLAPFKLCLGGKLGSGNQCISWISIDDLIHIIDYALKQTALRGPVNAVSPYPISNSQFVKTLGGVLYRPTLLKVPASVLKLVYGEMAEELLLGSQKVMPAVLNEGKFHFDYPRLDRALLHLLT